MPKFDNPTKRLMQTRTHDWIRLVYPDCREEWIQPLETEIRPTEKSQLDGVYRIDDGEKILYMNLEPQAYLDPGLYPLMVFMKEEPGETPEQIMQLTVDTIETVESQPLKKELYTTAAIFASERFTINFVKKFIRRETIMESALLKELFEEEREKITKEMEKIANEEMEKITKEMERKIYEHERKAATEGLAEGLTEAIIVYIEEKYEWVSKTIKEKVRKIQDLETLNALHRKIIHTETLEACEKLIDKALSVV